MQLSSGDDIVFSKKFKKQFWPQKHEKPHSKVAHNRPRHFYFTVQPRNLGTRHLFFYLCSKNHHLNSKDLKRSSIFSKLLLLGISRIVKNLHGNVHCDVRVECACILELPISMYYMLFNLLFTSHHIGKTALYLSNFMG